MHAHLVAVVLGGKGLERGLDDATAETEDKVQGRLLLDVVVGEGAAILKLLAGEDEALLIRGNAFLVLDLGLHVVCSSAVNKIILGLFRWRCALRDAIAAGCRCRRRGMEGVRTDGVRGLHLKGDGLARHCIFR